MHRLGRTFRTVVVAGAVALAMTAVGCGGSATSTTAASTKVNGGVASWPLVGEAPSWIWPFMPSQDFAVNNAQQFQWLMYRPLYMFGDNGDSTTVNYALSPARAPVYTDGGKTVVITFKGWKWSDGETVSAQDVIFWLNMMKAEKANYAGYAPGLLPDNLLSYAATGPGQVTLHLNQAYSSYWYTYNQLAEITPMPAAWDVTSLTAAPGSGGCATSVTRCAAVYKFLTAQATLTATYATSRIWATVDGPWRLHTFTTAGNDTFIPNPRYSGAPKPQLAELKIVTYSTDSTGYAALQAGQVDMGHIPVEDLPPRAPGSWLPSANPLGSGYTLAPFFELTIFYYQPNFDNPVLGPVFRQLYVRQALQDVADQTTMDATVLHGYGLPTTGGVPDSPPNQWEPAIQSANGGAGPYPFSITAARSLLTSHGWTQHGAVMTCTSPGTGRADCGAGIGQGRKLAFTLIWATGFAATGPMMDLYQADAAKAGIDISLSSQPFNTLINDTPPCSGTKCTWDAVYYGNWVFNGPGFEPTGEAIFQTGAGANSGSYSNPVEDQLINATHTSSSLATFHQYATYTAEQLPAIWMPDQYSIWGISAKLHNVYLSPIDTFLPEYWYLTK